MPPEDLHEGYEKGFYVFKPESADGFTEALLPPPRNSGTTWLFQRGVAPPQLGLLTANNVISEDADRCKLKNVPYSPKFSQVAVKNDAA